MISAKNKQLLPSQHAGTDHAFVGSAPYGYTMKYAVFVIISCALTLELREISADTNEWATRLPFDRINPS